MARFPAAAFYLTSHRIFHALHAAIQALFEGVWLGLLSDSAIDEICQLSYGTGKDYIGEDYLDSGLQFWEEIAVRRFFTPGCSVFVGGAGGGRELIALARAGFRPDGFECSRTMVASGQRALSRRGIAARLEWAAPCRLPDTIRDIYHAAIVGWNSYTYMLPRSRRVAFLKSLKNTLRAEAPILVSCAITGTGSGLYLWTPRIANAVRRLTLRRPVFEYGDTFPGRPRHNFTRRQLEAELIEAGFAPAAFWRWGNFAACVAHNGPGAHV